MKEVVEGLRTNAGSWSSLGDDIFLGRVRIAQVTGSGTRYFHADHLGSVRRVSTGAGALEKAYDFYPYGLPVKETVGQERLWFGGYELEHQNTSDYTDDLYFLHARWYFPSMGRFLSPDPVRGDPAQPQSLNLYAYVRGNPLNAVDPDGRAALWLRPSRERAMAMAASEADFVDSLAVWMLMKDMIWYALPQQSPGAGGGGGNSSKTGSGQPQPSASQSNNSPGAMSFEQVAEVVENENQSRLSKECVICLIWKESSFNPSAKNPASSATGLMQVTEPAAKTVGADHSRMQDPAATVRAGTSYLRWLSEHFANGDKTTTLELYNLGPASAKALISGKIQPTYAPAIVKCEECLKNGATNPASCLGLVHP